VDDALLVGFLEPFRHLEGDGHGLVGVQGPRGKPVLQGLAFHVLHGDEGAVLQVIDLVDGAEVGVAQAGGGPGFVQESGLALLGAHDPGREELQGNDAVELRVVGAVDHSHPPLTELREDGIVGDGLTDHRHGRNSACIGQIWFSGARSPWPRGPFRLPGRLSTAGARWPRRRTKGKEESMAPRAKCFPVAKEASSVNRPVLSSGAFVLLLGMVLGASCGARPGERPTGGSREAPGLLTRKQKPAGDTALPVRSAQIPFGLSAFFSRLSLASPHVSLWPLLTSLSGLSSRLSPPSYPQPSAGAWMNGPPRRPWITPVLL